MTKQAEKLKTESRKLKKHFATIPLFLFCFLLSAFCFSAFASSNLTATVTITNGPATNGNTFVLNSVTRTFTQQVYTAATQIYATNTHSLANTFTNLYYHLLSYPPPNVSVYQTGTNTLRLNARTDTPLTLTGSGNYFSVSYSTQSVTLGTNVQIPASSYPSGQIRTNVANELVNLINYATTPLGVAASVSNNVLTTASDVDVTNIVNTIGEDNGFIRGPSITPMISLIGYPDEGTLAVQYTTNEVKTLLGVQTAENVTSGYFHGARLGEFYDQNPGARFLRNDAGHPTWQTISGTGLGDLLAANNLADVEHTGTSRTNLGAHDGFNITTNYLLPARLATNTPTANQILQASSATTAKWVSAAGGGAGDLLAANNLTDVASIGQSRTNLGAHNAANLTTNTVPAAQLGNFNSLTGRLVRAHMSANDLLTNTGSWISLTNHLTFHAGDIQGDGIGVVGDVYFYAGTNQDLGPGVRPGNFYFYPGKALYVNKTGTNFFGTTYSGFTTHNDFTGTNQLRDHTFQQGPLTLSNNVAFRGVGSRVTFDDLQDGAPFTNLLYASIVTSADDGIAVTPSTNTTTGQRTYAVGLTPHIRTNIAGLNTNAIWVTGLTGCALAYNHAFLTRWDDTSWSMPGYSFADSPVTVSIAPDEPADLIIETPDGNDYYTNSAGEGVLGSYDLDFTTCASAAASVTVELVDLSPSPVIVYTPRYTAGLIVESNSWTLRSNVMASMAEGDVWYTSSNGVPTTISLRGGAYYFRQDP